MITKLTLNVTLSLLSVDTNLVIDTDMSVTNTKDAVFMASLNLSEACTCDQYHTCQTCDKYGPQGYTNPSGNITDPMQ